MAIKFSVPRKSLRRASARELNKTADEQKRNSTLAHTALNKTIPVAYGESRITGLHLVEPREYMGNWVGAVAWSEGECEGVQGDLIINGAYAPGGVTGTHYNGTDSQGIDPTLAAAIPGFADKFTDIAYTVFVIPTSVIDGFPQQRQIEAVFRGRMVLDPRTSIVAWSQNPALCVADLIQSERYGPAMTVYGVEDCANRCEEIAGGFEVRSQIGLTISAEQELEQLLDFLTSHGGMLWAYHDEGVLLVPDAPVVEPAVILTRGDIIAGSLDLTGASLDNAPTSVTVTYTAKTGTVEAWRSLPSAPAEVPGVDTGQIPKSPSDVSLPGIQRPTEAYRIALARLRRLQHPGRYAWQAKGTGVQFVKGDVVQLPNMQGLTDVEVRVMSAHMYQRDRYQITAEYYSPSLYPDDVIPTDQTNVPVNGGLLYLGSELPDGWEWFSDADGVFPTGGDALTYGETGGSTDLVVSGITTSSGAHGDDSSPGEDWSYGEPGGAGTGSYQNKRASVGNHVHTYSTTVEHTPLYRRMPIIRKVGLPGPIPVNAGVLCDGELISVALEAVVADAGRMFMPGPHALGGNSSPRNVSVLLSEEQAHDHRNNPRAVTEQPGFDAPFNYRPAGKHRHLGTTITVSIDPKRCRLAHYSAVAETQIIPGSIILWLTVDPPPTGWYEMDGNNGTLDMTGVYITFSTPGEAGVIVGDNTANWGNSTTTDKHNHKGSPRGSNTKGTLAYHDGDVSHAHVVSGSPEYIAPYFRARLIQYTGAE